MTLPTLPLSQFGIFEKIRVEDLPASPFTDTIGLIIASLVALSSLLLFWYRPLRVQWRLCPGELPGNYVAMVLIVVFLGAAFPLLFLVPAHAPYWLGVAVILIAPAIAYYRKAVRLVEENRFDRKYTAKKKVVKTCTVIGCDTLTEHAAAQLAKARAEGKSVTHQDLFAGLAYKPDAMWERPPRVAVRSRLLSYMLVVLICGNLTLLIVGLAIERSLHPPRAAWELAVDKADALLQAGKGDQAVAWLQDALRETDDATGTARLRAKLVHVWVQLENRTQNPERAAEYDAQIVAATAAMQVRIGGAERWPAEFVETAATRAEALLRQADRSQGAERSRLIKAALTTAEAALKVPATGDKAGWVAAARAAIAVQLAVAGDMSGEASVAAARTVTELCDQIILLRPRETDPRQWGLIKCEQAKAYHGWAIGRAGAERLRLLERAAACYQDYLDVARDEAPSELRLRAVASLGDVWREQAALMPPADAEALAPRAVTMIEHTLESGGRQVSPYAWAQLNAALGLWQYARLAWKPQETWPPLLAASELAFQRALTVFTIANHPKDWASTQSNLANLYRAWAVTGKTDGESLAHLGKAQGCLENALQVFLPATSPEPWRICVMNAANVAADRARLLPGPQRQRSLDSAVKYYREGLKHLTRTADADDWGLFHSNLGQVLTRYAEVEGIDQVELAAHLTEAEAMLREALIVRTRGAAPLDWAVTMKALGDVHSYRAQSVAANAGAKYYEAEKAIEAYSAALEVFTAVESPDWHRELTGVISQLRAAFPKP